MGGAAIASVVARVSLTRSLKIRFHVIVGLWLVLFGLSGCLSVQRSSIQVIERSLVENGLKKSVFLAFELNRLRQLSRRHQNKTDKSRNVKSFSQRKPKCFALSGFFGWLLIFALSIAVTTLTKALIFNLLFRSGVEVNPGPEAAAKLDLLSQNCRGLSDRKKLIRIVKKIYPSTRKSAHRVIACLQETHKLDKFVLRNLYRGVSVIDDGTRNQRGVCILIPESFDLDGSRVSGVGRWAIATVKCKEVGKSFIVATIYAPNCHREGQPFFHEFFSNLDEVSSELITQGRAFETIVCGDLNVVLDPVSGSANRTSTRAELDLANLIRVEVNSRGLVEADNLSQAGAYTWRRGICLSKLDYVFMSRPLKAKVASAATSWYEFGANLDHASVKICLDLAVKVDRGRSFVKLFKSDISTALDKQWLAEQIRQQEDQIPDHWSPHLKLEFIKSTLRSKTLELRLMKKFSSSSTVLRERINVIVNKSPLTIEDSNQVEVLRVQLREAEEVESEIQRIKAGVRWREEGERSTSYFLSRFKARSEGSVMHAINLGTRVVTGAVRLTSVVKQFYQRLYNSPAPTKLSDPRFCDSFFANCPTLTREQQLIMAEPITLEELKKALSTCKDSAPGLDGIPYSFYSSLSDSLLKYVLESWNYALETGALAQSHRQSCITLLPKKDKDLSLIGNWRPISLSACDLKIITKSYANRLKLVLPHVICEAQAAYIPGRDISFNNRLLQHAKSYANARGLDFSVVSLDAQKAFDSVSHEYLEKVLQVYNFPPEFIAAFKTLYANLTSVVQVNGFLSTEFDICNGVKQGDALSCSLFILAIDPLLRNLTENLQIEGLAIPVSTAESIEIKVLAYADDITIVCKNGAFQPIFEEYERLSLTSGLKLNADKTEVFNLIQSPVTGTVVNYLGKIVNLGRVDKLRTCGIWMANSADVEYHANVLSKIKSMEECIIGWGRRNLSINGRMTLAKTFLLSLIVFPAQVIQFNKKEINKIEKLIYSFVNGATNLYGPERIARRTLKAPKEKGGINGIDVECFMKSIILKQFSKAASKHSVLSRLQLSFSAPSDDISRMAKAFLRTNIRHQSMAVAMPDLRQIELISSIPLPVLLAPNSNSARLAERHELISLGDLQLAINAGRIARGQLNGIMRAVPRQLSNFVRTGVLVQAPARAIWFTDSDLNESVLITSKKFRSDLLQVKFTTLEVKLENIYKRADWPPPGIASADHFQNIWTIKNPTLRAIRLKVSYKDIFANERRFRFKMSDSPLCECCGSIETVEHQLATCINATRIWDLYHSLTGSRINSLYEVIRCGTDLSLEIVKSVLLKALIQIDRSSRISDRALRVECAFYLKLEARVNTTQATRLQQLADSMLSIP